MFIPQKKLFNNLKHSRQIPSSSPPNGLKPPTRCHLMEKDLEPHSFLAQMSMGSCGLWRIEGVKHSFLSRQKIEPRPCRKQKKVSKWQNKQSRILYVPQSSGGTMSSFIPSTWLPQPFWGWKFMQFIKRFRATKARVCFNIQFYNIHGW